MTRTDIDSYTEIDEGHPLIALLLAAYSLEEKKDNIRGNTLTPVAP